jgi:signal transduction histidine kinase
MLKDAFVSHLSTLTGSLCYWVGKQMYMVSGDPSWKKYSAAQQKRAIAADFHLRKLLKNEPSLQAPPMEQVYDGISRSQVHVAMTPFLIKLEGMSEAESKAVAKSIDSLRLILYSGVTAGIVVSILLAIFFCLNITNRLLIIVNNALSLSQGTALNPPFKGDDEIGELDQLLFKSASEIRELERFKKEMVGVVSHELKSPLSSVGSFLSSLSAGVYGELPAKSQDKANRTYAGVKRLMGLVSELLYLDRLELDMNPETLKVDELVAASVDTVKELSEKSGIDIKIISQGGEVYADRNRLLQVIVNLLSNAMKFSPENGVVIIEAQSKDGLFECRVTDEGKGIPESFRKQIFEPFKQVDATDSTSKKGTGLGLTISRSIVEQHGGQIGVDSAEGKGSTFWFKIPQKFNAEQKSKSNHAVAEVGLGALTLAKSPGQLQSGKFRVLYQGLVIIALPLIFQISFAFAFNNMLDGLCKQTEREERSMKILNSLNRGTDAVVGAIQPATLAVYLPSPNAEKMWEEGAERALVFLNQAVELSKDNSLQLKDLTKAKQYIEGLRAMFQREFKTHESRKVFDSLSFNYRKMVYNLNGLKLKPSNAEEIAADESDEALNPLIMLEGMRGLTHDYVHQNIYHFLDVKKFLDSGMDRENSISKKAAKQRSKMMNDLKLALICAVAITIALSTLISLFLMRSISSRLQHIMQNTERLARREPLAPALPGYDEIALLDKVLVESGNRLMELETFKRELVSIVSHELRTPLLSISSALELFSTGMMGELTEKGKNRLSYAQGEADRLIRLINDLLDIEKMEAGKFVLDFTEVSIVEMVESSVSAAAQLAEAKQVTIETEIADTNGTIFADRDRLCQVFINLLSNAIKYSPEKAKIIVSAEKINDAQIKFSIIDQGRGIPEELRQKIFDRFVQVEKSDATERGGTGLGLAICKAIVEQHGGEIGVDSQIGAGSTFWFMMPINSSSKARKDIELIAS